MKLKSRKIGFIKIILIILINIFNIVLILLSFHCKECIKRYSKFCQVCLNEILFDGLNIASREETIKEIIVNNKSIARYGDGEFEIIFGNRISFQDSNKFLKNKLLEVLNSNLDNLLIGLNIPYQQKYLNSRPNYGRIFWETWFKLHKFSLAKIINKTKKFYSTVFTRFYSVYKKKKRNKIFKYILKLKKIWDKRDILIIEGFFSRNGVGNDLFNNAKSIKRILCPNKNAYNFYERIIYNFQKLKLDKNILILISLGPTATILSYDLCRMGFQVVDIGHCDIEYELYLRKYNSIKKISYKFVNEAKDGDKNISNITDQNYYKQIVSRILN